MAECGVICNLPLSTPPCLVFPELPIPVLQSYLLVLAQVAPCPSDCPAETGISQSQRQQWEESKPVEQQEPCLTSQEANCSLPTRLDLCKPQECNPSLPGSWMPISSRKESPLAPGIQSLG